MNKRPLKKWVDFLLRIITCFDICLLFGLVHFDFTPAVIFFIIITISSFIFNIMILNKYGRVVTSE